LRTTIDENALVSMFGNVSTLPAPSDPPEWQDDEDFETTSLRTHLTSSSPYSSPKRKSKSVISPKTVIDPSLLHSSPTLSMSSPGSIGRRIRVKSFIKSANNSPRMEDMNSERRVMFQEGTKYERTRTYHGNSLDNSSTPDRSNIRIAPMTEQPKGKIERRRPYPKSPSDDDHNSIVFNMQHHPLFLDLKKDASNYSSPMLEFRRGRSDKSFSTNDIVQVVTDQRRREDTLVHAKRTCDTELDTFMDLIIKQRDAINIIKTSETQLAHIKRLVNTFERFSSQVKSLSIDEIRQGRCNLIVDQLAAIQQNCFIQNQNHYV